MTIAQRFNLIFLSTLVILSGLYTGAFFYQSGAPLAAEYWVRDYVIVKNEIAARTPSPRIIFLGGSSGLGGIDSALVQNVTGLPVVNFSLHAGIPADWLLRYADIASSGDVLILPFEWEYYVTDFKWPSAWTMDQDVAWNQMDYFTGLDLLGKIRYFSSLPIGNVRGHVSDKLKRASILERYPARTIRTPAEVVAIFQDESLHSKKFSYDILNINSHGDLMNTCLEPKPGIESYNYPVTATSKINEGFKAALEKTVRNLSSRGVKVYVAFPPIISTAQTREPWFQTKLSEFETELHAMNINTIGKPSEEIYDLKNFYDSAYHLNCNGSEIRSKKLAAQIKNEIQLR
jgi:hypothetical protein